MVGCENYKRRAIKNGMIANACHSVESNNQANKLIAHDHKLHKTCSVIAIAIVMQRQRQLATSYDLFAYFDRIN